MEQDNSNETKYALAKIVAARPDRKCYGGVEMLLITNAEK